MMLELSGVRDIDRRSDEPIEGLDHEDVITDTSSEPLTTPVIVILDRGSYLTNKVEVMATFGIRSDTDVMDTELLSD